MLMLAFVDGSGTINDSPVYVMAGYLGPVSAWEAFTSEWQAALDHPKAIEYFKMSEAWMRRGQFDGWDPSIRDARLKMLPPIINRHAAAAFMFVVTTEAWKRHFVGRLTERYHDRPYFFAFHGVMSGVVKYLNEKGIKEKIDFVFDEEGGESSRLMLEGFDEFVSCAPDHLKEYIGSKPVYRNEKEVLPLQAADILAWHVRRSYADGIQGKNVDHLTEAMPELFNIEQARAVWNEAKIKNIIQFILNRSFAKSLDGIPLTLPDPTSSFRL
jgi:Protein of unknown function (DUF3800)